jgi:hypothetical protein
MEVIKGGVSEFKNKEKEMTDKIVSEMREFLESVSEDDVIILVAQRDSYLHMFSTGDGAGTHLLLSSAVHSVMHDFMGG